MKIVHLSTYDIKGGAAKAAFRLHQALRKIGIDSFLIVEKKFSNDNFTIELSSSKKEQFRFWLKKVFSNLIVKSFLKTRKDIFSIPSLIENKKLIKTINEINPQIIQVHWVGHSFLSLTEFLSLQKPIILTLHDIWLFSGGCHLSYGCRKFQKHCQNCAYFQMRIKKDLSYFGFKRKEKAYQKLDFSVIGPSKWITDLSKKAQLFKRAKRIEKIVNILDERLKPFPRQRARELLRLPKEKKLIGFGAFDVTNEQKGFFFLRKALKELEKKYQKEIMIIIFGSNSSKLIETQFSDLKLSFHTINFIKSETDLAKVYSALDVFVLPSIEENLSNMLLESLTCLTPVIAFSTGGNSDIIDHLKNGYLAKERDTMDLAKAIEWVLFESDQKLIKEYCRYKIEKDFSNKKTLEKYLAFYQKIL